MPVSDEVVFGWIILLATAAGVIGYFMRRQAATLVLQKFSFSAPPQPATRPTVEIVGRVRGIIAFVLTLVGFSPITRFTIAGTELRYQTTSLLGQRSHFIPLRCVASVAAGVHKPLTAIVMAALMTVLGIYGSIASGSWAPVAIGLVLAIGLVVLYLLSKKFYVEVYANGGPPIILMFKPNVLEGVPIDVEQALDVIGVIRDLVMQQGPAAAAAARGVPAVPVEAPASEPALPPPPPPAASSTDYAAAELEAMAGDLFAEAKKLAQAGQRSQAIAMLQDLVCQFPDTRAAERARRSLDKSGAQVG